LQPVPMTTSGPIPNGGFPVKTLSLLLLFVALGTSQPAVAAPAPPTPLDALSADSIQCPAEPGVYLARAGGWKKMEEVHSIETGRRGRGLSSLAYGLRPTRNMAVFPERTAPIKVSSAVAIFCVVDLADQSRDLRMVRLVTSSQVRQMEIRDEGSRANEHSDINEKDRVFFDARKLADRTFILQAPVDLRPGEYVLFPSDELAKPANALLAFDFSIEGEGLLRRMHFER
jgi:hypothetical protein